MRFAYKSKRQRRAARRYAAERERAVRERVLAVLAQPEVQREIEAFARMVERRARRLQPDLLRQAEAIKERKNDD